MTTITIHSFKGGTGKSLISTSLAYYYATKLKKKTLIIDGDYSAPCFRTYFPIKSNVSVTPFSHYLEDAVQLKETLYKSQYPNLHVSYAAPPDFNEKMLTADTKLHGEFLKKLIKAKDILENQLNFDRVIFDSSNGVNLSAINQLAISDKSIVVIRPSRYGITSSYDLIRSIYKRLTHLSKTKRHDFFIWNQVPQSEDNHIIAHLNEWNSKFNAIELPNAATIYYSSEITESMIIDKKIDLGKIATVLDSSIKNIAESIE